MSDKPTIIEQWTAFIVRVSAWLAMTFWNDSKMTQMDKENIERWVALGEEDDSLKEDMMNRIKTTAKSYKDSDNPLQGGRRSATPLYTDAWKVISQNPQLAITLLTLKKGEKRTLEESSKNAINRLRQLVKINNFTTVAEITEHLTIGTGEIASFYGVEVEMDEDGRVTALAEEPTEGENLEG